MIPIEVHPEASEELEQAVRWYEARSIRAARRFVLAVDDAIRKIRETPNRFFQIDRRNRVQFVQVSVSSCFPQRRAHDRRDRYRTREETSSLLAASVANTALTQSTGATGRGGYASAIPATNGRGPGGSTVSS